MSSRLYCVMVRYVATPMDPAPIDAVLDKDRDWIRFNAMTWFVWTRRSAEDLSQSVKSVLKTGDNVVITSVQPELAKGAADQWVWTWLNDRMGRQFRGED